MKNTLPAAKKVGNSTHEKHRPRKQNKRFLMEFEKRQTTAEAKRCQQNNKQARASPKKRLVLSIRKDGGEKKVPST